jgi:AcrR family transcriptional regulator
MPVLDGTTTRKPPARARNRRGEGQRLHDELIAAALMLVEEEGGEALSLRGLARRVGIAATSIYLHFPDLTHLRDALVERCFAELAQATGAAAAETADPAEELRARCRAYCAFALAHPHLYQLMFYAALPTIPDGDPAATPGRRSFEKLVKAVEHCRQSGIGPRQEDPFRLASLIWAAEHGIAMARIARPTFPWPRLEPFVDEMVDRLMGFSGAPRTGATA